MSLIKSGVGALIESINRLNPGVNLVQNEYNYGTPTALVDDPDNYNTTITITEKNTQSSYEGSVVVKYNRRELADLQALLPAHIPINGVTTTGELVVALNGLFGLDFVSADVVAGPLNLVDGYGDVLVTAAAGSIGWAGSMTLSLQPGLFNLPTYVTVRDLPGFNYPGQDINRPFAGFYSYWRDFSSVSAYLDDQVEGSPNLGDLALALVTITGNAWVTTGTATYSLEGATLDYNGITDGDNRFNDDYEFAALVTLSASCTGMTGQLVIHYGLRS